MRRYVEEDGQHRIQKMEVGDKLVTRSRVITKTDLELFAVCTGATAPLFLSEDYAKSVGWKTQLTPGLLTYSVALGLMIQSGFLADVVAYIGTNNMKFIAPVYPYDTIRVEVEVLGKKQTKKGNFVCDYKWVIKNQHDEAVAEGENTSMCKPG